MYLDKQEEAEQLKRAREEKERKALADKKRKEKVKDKHRANVKVLMERKEEEKRVTTLNKIENNEEKASPCLPCRLNMSSGSSSNSVDARRSWRRSNEKTGKKPSIASAR